MVLTPSHSASESRKGRCVFRHMPNTPDEPKFERIADQSPDIQAELREQLRALVPEAFAEGKLDAGS
jgi:hypothetical protein